MASNFLLFRHIRNFLYVMSKIICLTMGRNKYFGHYKIDYFYMSKIFLFNLYFQKISDEKSLKLDRG